jgi:Domain of unknown function (DUF4136)
MSFCSRERQKGLFVVLALACLLCCVTAAQTDESQENEESGAVRTSHAAGVNFSKYHTYKWVEIKGQHPDPIVDAQIKQSIDSRLAAKGLTKADDAADLNVDYQTAMSQVKRWKPYEDWTAPMMEQRLPHYKEVMIEVGTLVVDMYDTAAKNLVWTGRAHKTLDPNSSPKDRQKNLDKAVAKLLADFPPK